MRMRIFVSIAFVLFGIAFLCVVTELNPGVLIDTWSIVIAIVFPFVYTGILEGFAGFGLAFSAPLERNADLRALRKSVAFLNTLSISMIAFAALGMVVSLIAMFSMLEDRSKIGPTLAICLISFLYAVIMNLVLVIPFRETARKRIAEMEAG